MSSARTIVRDAYDIGPPSYPEEAPVGGGAVAVRSGMSEAERTAIDLGAITPRQPIELAAPAMLSAAVSGKIATRLAAVMAEVEWVSKRGTNAFHKYDYASIDDMRGMLGRLCGRNGLSWRQDEVRMVPLGTRAVAVTYQFTLCAADEPDHEGYPTRVTVMVSIMSSKGGLDEKAFGKARSQAWKDWAKAQFCIPTGEAEPVDEGDPESTDNHGAQSAIANDRTPAARLDGVAARHTTAAASAPRSVPKAATAAEWVASFSRMARECRRVEELEELCSTEDANLESLPPPLRAECDKAIDDMKLSFGV